MNLFGKGNKKKKANGTEPVSEAVVAQDTVTGESSEDGGKAKKSAKKQAKPRKSRDGMSSVIQESVTETIIEMGFMHNDNFIHDGRYVGLFLETERIGGLNKKSARDEDKGSIIEHINAGHICALVTDELMEAEAMVIAILPNTIDVMLEYSSVLDIDYPLCYLSEDGDVEVLSQTVTLEQLHELLMRDGSIDEILGGSTGAGSTAQEDDDEEEFLDTGSEGTDTSSNAGFANESEIEDIGSDTPFGDEDSAPVVQEQHPTAYDDEGSNWSGETYDSGESMFEDMAFEDEEEGSGMDDETEEITPDEFEQAMVRKLYSDDLGLEITTQAFDTQFLHGNSFIPFSENRGEGWLNGYLEQMSRDANSELRRLHQDNLLSIRSTYFSMLSLYAADIAKKLDYQDPNTESGADYQAICDAKAMGEENIDEAVSARRMQIADDWERRLSDVSSSAASAAVQQYRERHEKQHNDALYRVEQEMRAKIDDEYNDNLRSLNDQRREEAAKMMDMGVQAALAEVSKMYLACLEDENARYKEYQKAMLEFVDTNRKDEMTRIEVLREQQRQTEKADAVMAECTSKMQRQTEEFEARRKALSEEIDQLRRKFRDDLAAKDKEYEEGLRKANADHDTLQGRIDNLLAEVTRLDDKKEQEYAARMDALIAEREAADQKYEHLVDMVKKERMMVVTACTVGVVASLVVGFVAGEFVNIKGKSAKAQQGITQQLNESMDNIDFNLPEGYDAHVDDDGNVTITRTGVDGETETDSVSE